jgi:hypothetical protein
MGLNCGVQVFRTPVGNSRAPSEKAFGEFEVEWSNGENFSRQAGNVSFTVADRDTYVVARVHDMHCYNADTTFITVNNPVNFDLGNGVKIKPGQEHTFKPSIYFDSWETDTILTYNWFKDYKGNSISTQPFLTVNETAVYYLEIGDSLDCKSIDSVALLVTASVNNQQVASDFRVFPNPAQNQIRLQFDGHDGELEIYDINGRIVFSNQVFNQQIVDLENLVNGTYLIRLNVNDKLKTQVLVKN